MQDKDLKREFELERVILFSDAVFAIVITIMILDVKLPDGLRHASPEQLRGLFIGLIPKFAAYLFSFFIVSGFWIRHLRIFKTLRNYDTPLVVRNLLFLFVISIFPFAISTTSGNLSLRTFYSVDIYVTMILLGILTQSIIIHYIVRHKEKLCFESGEIAHILKWKVHRLNFILIPVALVIVVALNLLDVYPPWVVYVMAFYAITIRLFTKKYYPGLKRVNT